MFIQSYTPKSIEYYSRVFTYDHLFRFTEKSMVVTNLSVIS